MTLFLTPPIPMNKTPPTTNNPHHAFLASTNKSKHRQFQRKSPANADAKNLGNQNANDCSTRTNALRPKLKVAVPSQAAAQTSCIAKANSELSSSVAPTPFKTGQASLVPRASDSGLVAVHTPLIQPAPPGPVAVHTPLIQPAPLTASAPSTVGTVPFSANRLKLETAPQAGNHTSSRGRSKRKASTEAALTLPHSSSTKKANKQSRALASLVSFRYPSISDLVNDSKLRKRHSSDVHSSSMQLLLSAPATGRKQTPVAMNGRKQGRKQSDPRRRQNGPQTVSVRLAMPVF